MQCFPLFGEHLLKATVGGWEMKQLNPLKLNFSSTGDFYCMASLSSYLSLLYLIVCKTVFKEEADFALLSAAL